MSEYNEQELVKAVAYLQNREIYIADTGNKFLPTDSKNTDVSKTIARYRLQMADKKIEESK